MIRNIEIVIIAPDYLMDLATKTAEKLSSRNETKAKAFEAKAFEANPRSPRPGRFFISLGATSENKFTKKSIPKMTQVYPENSPYMAYNSHTALIFSEEVAQVKEILKAIPRESLKVAVDCKDRTIKALKFLGKKTHIIKGNSESETWKDSQGNENELENGASVGALVSAGAAGAVSGVPVLKSVLVSKVTVNAYNRTNEEIRADRMPVILKEFLDGYFEQWISEGLES